MELNILYEDKNIIVCNKAAGVPVQSDKTFDADMVSQIYAYEKQKGEPVYAAVINRLDKPVRGIVLFAKNKATAGLLSDKTNYKKTYTATVTGVFDEKEGIMEDYLLKDSKTNTSRVVKKEVKGAKKAELKYKVMEEVLIGGKKYSKVEIELLTGRHHQIRVQFSSRGHALYGDRKYNSEAPVNPKDNVALCASRLEFMYAGKKMHFEV